MYLLIDEGYFGGTGNFRSIAGKARHELRAPTGAGVWAFVWSAQAGGVTLPFADDSGDCERLHTGANLGCAEYLGAAKVTSRLKVKPELGGVPEKGAERNRGFGGNAATAFDDFGNTGWGETSAACKLGLTEVHLVEELTLKDASGRGVDDGESFGCQCVDVCHGGVSFRGLVVVGDLYVMGVRSVPAEADAPLLVDANRALSQSVAAEGF